MDRASGTLLGIESTRQLETCTEDIQDVFYEAAEVMNFSVLEGKRSVRKQQAVYDAGYSEILNSKHVYPIGKPSLAIDIAPYPLKWPQKPRWIRKLMWKAVQKYIKQVARFYFLAGYIKCTADYNGVKLRWGGDWSGTMDFEMSSFDDLGHFELVTKEE